MVRLVEQKEECGPGEPYQPLDVNALFGQPTVALRGPWNAADLVKIGPTARDLTRRALRLPPRLPGRRALPGLRLRALGPAHLRGPRAEGVRARRDRSRAPGSARPAVLVLLRLQRLEQPARRRLGDDPARLRRRQPRAMRSRSDRRASATASTRERSRRAGATTSSTSSTAPIRSSTRRPARTRTSTTRACSSAAPPSRASAATTRTGPHDDLRPAVATIPSDPAQARAEFPWIDFQGRWGELQPAFFNGPTGPNLKTQWTQPITWSEGWRDQSFTVPAGSAFGTAATDFFCRAIGNGSRALVQLVHRPLAVHAGARGAGAAAPLRPLANLVAPGRAASPGAPARVGPDARRSGAHVPRETGTDARDRDAVHPDRAPDRALAVARWCTAPTSSASRPAAGRAGCSASSCWRSGRR